jgi:enoyl-CoA hydratase/carnithine racemase
MISNHVTSLVNQIPSTSTLILQISRPEAFNALNFNITYYIIQELEKARKSSKPVVITGIQKRFFGSGGDLRLVTQRYLENPEFMRSLHHMFYLTSLIEKSISFWTGYAIGSSAGLACSCKTRVALPSSKYSMPENGIGVFPNVGASYFLSHFVEKPIGLYISLTGIMLNGVDCYVLGLCNYFVYEESYEQIIEECRFEDPLQVVKKYHRTPDIG